jgi:Flp pilus assembly protein TadG
MKGRALLRDQQGAVAVEFALVSSAFFALLIGLCYLGVMLFNNMSLQWAVEKAARVAEINAAATQSDIQTAVNSYLSSVGLPNATVAYSSSVSNGVTTGTITASYSQSYTLPMISTFNINFSSNLSVPLAS